MQGEVTMLSNTGALQDLLLVPTPAHDTTRMVHDSSQCVGEGWPPVVLSLLQSAHTSNSSLYGSLLLDKTTLGGEDSTMVDNSTMKGEDTLLSQAGTYQSIHTLYNCDWRHSLTLCS